MMVSACAGCGHQIGWAFVAQYRVVVPGQKFTDDIVVCPDCWNAGFRMWIDGTGKYIISKECPEGYKEAMLYWDEMGVTGRTPEEFTYPKVEQPL